MQTEIIVAVIGLAGIVFASQGFWSWLINRNRKKSAETRMILGIGYSKIVQLCEMHIENGYITKEAYKDLKHYLYEPYHDMKGNGTVDRLMKEIDELPIKSKEVQHDKLESAS